MNVLVTGGRGYLGGRLCQFLTNLGQHKVWSGSRKVSSGISPGIEQVFMDWSSQESLLACCRGMDAVVHCAAMNAADCMADPVAALTVNVLSTARLLQAAKVQGVRRFIYLSTAHVYGNPLVGVLTEETLPFPVHPYATSHRAAEDLVFTASENGEIEGVVLRLSNAFGAPVDVSANCWDLLLNNLCRQIVLEGAITLRSTGMERRDFVPITDVCRVIAHLLDLPFERYEKRLFNIGGGWSPTVYEAALLLAERFESMQGERAVIHRKMPSATETTGDLSYTTEKICSTGFSFDTSKVKELDELITFCSATFG